MTKEEWYKNLASEIGRFLAGDREEFVANNRAGLERFCEPYRSVGIEPAYVAPLIRRKIGRVVFAGKL